MASSTRFDELFLQYCNSGEFSASLEDAQRLFTDQTQIRLNEQLTRPGTSKPIVVYLDPTIPHNTNIEVFRHNIRTFAHTASCLAYITSINKNRMFLLTVSSLAKQIIPFIFNQTNVAFIYVYSDSKTKNDIDEKWISKYSSKVFGIFQNRHSAYNRSYRDIFTASVNFRSFMVNPTRYLIETVGNYERVIAYLTDSNNYNNSRYYKNPPHDLPNMTICNLSNISQQSIRDLNKEDSEFMWFQLLIEILNRIPATDLSRKQLLDIARLNYATDERELEKILDFEMNYSAFQAIKWYTKDSFLYRLLNTALRTKDIDHIFIFREIIADMINQLKQLHEDFIETLPKNTQSFTVYRGEMMKIVDFEKIKNNIGSTISWNSFVLTSEYSDVALVFAGYGQCGSDQVSVLFEIELDKRLPTTIITAGNRFADIKKYSDKKDENEILLSVGSIFCIESIEEFDSFWHVKLVIVEERRNELMSYYLHQFGETTNVVILGKFLCEIGDYDRAIKYGHLLLDHFSSENEDQCMIGLIYNNLAMSYNAKGDITTAFDYCHRALNLLTDESPPDDSIFVTIFNNLGVIHMRRAEYTSAIEMFSRVLLIAKDDAYIIGTAHIHLALAYSEQGYVKNVDEHVTKAVNILSIDLEIPKTHLTYGSIYNTFGLIYANKNEFAKAEEFFEQAYSIEATLLPQDHSSIGIKLGNMTFIHIKNEDYDSALKKALDCLRSLPTESVDRAMALNNLGVIYRCIGEHQMALDAYYEALKFDRKFKSSSHPSFALRYFNIAVVHIIMLQFDVAENMLQKSLSIASNSSKAHNSKMMASIYRTLGMVHLALGNLSQGKSDIKKAHDLDPIINEQYPNPLAQVYVCLSHVFEINQRAKLAHKWFWMANAIQIMEDYLDEIGNNIPKIALAASTISHNEQRVDITADKWSLKGYHLTFILLIFLSVVMIVSLWSFCDIYTVLFIFSTEIAILLQKPSRRLATYFLLYWFTYLLLLSILVCLCTHPPNTLVTFFIFSVCFDSLYILQPLLFPDISSASLESSELSNTALNNTYTNPHLQRCIQDSVYGNLLSNMDLTDRDVSVVIQSGIRQKKFVCLFLEGNNLTSDSVKMLADELKTNTVLARLDLQRNRKIGDDGAQYLAQSLTSENRTLNELTLNDTGLTSQGILFLSDALRTNTSLWKLDLNENPGIGDIGVQHLARVLKNHNRTLVFLSLQATKLTYKGVQFLCDALQTNSILVSLDLGSNFAIGDNGAQYLSQLLASQKLFQVDLSECGLTNRGVQFLCDALRTNSTLSYLNLSFNKSITDESIPFLLQMREHNQTLTKLPLMKCSLSEDGEKRLEQGQERGTLFVFE